MAAVDDSLHHCLIYMLICWGYAGLAISAVAEKTVGAVEDGISKLLDEGS